MIDDIIDEEIRIMTERDEEPTTLSSATFKLPINELKLKPVITLDVSASLNDAIKLMQKNKFGSVIITESGKCTGIVTERDILLKVVGLIDDLTGTPISKVMTKDPLRLMKDDKVAFVMHNMHVGDFRHIPIVNENDEPISIVSIKDVNGFILDYFPESVMNICCTPYRGTSKRYGG
ncbi:MAG: CBS domain-containing protein [Bacteriovoracaceae bacterium]|nr:CBS domain-containing protein [Bacteriovoracaceae bacterium]